MKRVTHIWWRHQMETFSVLLAICSKNLPVTGEFPTQRLVTRSFDVFFYLCLTKRVSKQSRGWWFETPPRLSRRHHNENLDSYACRCVFVNWWRVKAKIRKPVSDNRESGVDIDQTSIWCKSFGSKLPLGPLLSGILDPCHTGISFAYISLITDTISRNVK